MPISITALVSYLFLILGPARALISAANCTDPTLNWVGYLCMHVLCKQQRSTFTGDLFEYSRSTRSNKVPA